MKTRNIIPEQKGEFTKVLEEFYVYTGDLNDKYVQRSCKDLGFWDKTLTEWMIKNIKPGWVCLDIGSNNGYFTDIMSRLSGPSGEVCAFEPIKHLYVKHLESISINDYKDCSPIILKNVALSNIDSDGYIRIRIENIGSSEIVDVAQEKPGQYYSEKIQLVRLENIIDKKIDFIKIDVEGHERFVLEGFGKLCKECPLIVIELGSHQPDEFIIELQKRYNMNFLNGIVATLDKIKKHEVIDVVMLKKDTND